MTHDGIYSRGPIVLVGDVYLMSEIYSKDLVWYGKLASSSGSGPNIGLPIITSTGNKLHSLGISPYSSEEEKQAVSNTSTDKVK